MIVHDSKRKGSLYLVSIVLVSILLIQGSSLCFAQNVVWTVTDNPSGSEDIPHAITADDTYIYVAGYDLVLGKHRWRIQKRDKSNGSLVWDVNDNPSSSDDIAHAITCDDTYVYMAGYRKYEGRAFSDRLLLSNFQMRIRSLLRRLSSVLPLYSLLTPVNSCQHHIHPSDNNSSSDAKTANLSISPLSTQTETSASDRRRAQRSLQDKGLC